MNKLFIFLAGVSIGSVVTFKFVEKKYKRIADEEIASVKESYGKQKQIDDACDYKKGASETFKQGVEDATEYISIVKENGYSNTKYLEMNKKKEIDDVEKPYVIPPEEFGIYSDYDTISLTYYADGVVADDDDELMDVEDVESAVGMDSLNHFGEYEDDSVFVRNDRRRVDYEILLSNKEYSDVLKSKPYLKED